MDFFGWITLIGIIIFALLLWKKNKTGQQNEDSTTSKSGGSVKVGKSPSLKGDALPGLFSISENKKVQFSRGVMKEKDGKRSITPSQLSTDNDSFNYNCDTFIKWETKSGVWRILSSEEWEYIVKNRPNASNLLGVAGVDDKYYGAVLLPDDFQLPAGVTFKPGLGPTWVVNKYTLQEWSQMEQAGAVFLPEGTFCDKLVNCIYWTSSAKMYTDQYGKQHIDKPYSVLFDSINCCGRIGDNEKETEYKGETMTLHVAMYRYVKDVESVG